MPSALVCRKSLDRSISNRKGVRLILLLHVPCFIEFSVFNANILDLDQTPRFVASDESKLFANVPFMGH